MLYSLNLIVCMFALRRLLLNLISVHGIKASVGNKVILIGRISSSE